MLIIISKNIYRKGNDKEVKIVTNNWLNMEDNINGGNEDQQKL